MAPLWEELAIRVTELEARVTELEAGGEGMAGADDEVEVAESADDENEVAVTPAKMVDGANRRLLAQVRTIHQQDARLAEAGRKIADLERERDRLDRRLAEFEQRLTLGTVRRQGLHRALCDLASGVKLFARTGTATRNELLTALLAAEGALDKDARVAGALTEKAANR